MRGTTKISKKDGEFKVRLFIDGEYQAGADYFTDDREDARATATDMRISAGLSDKTTDFAKDEQAEYDADRKKIYQCGEAVYLFTCYKCLKEFSEELEMLNFTPGMEAISLCPTCDDGGFQRYATNEEMDNRHNLGKNVYEIYVMGGPQYISGWRIKWVLSTPGKISLFPDFDCIISKNDLPAGNTKIHSWI